MSINSKKVILSRKKYPEKYKKHDPRIRDILLHMIKINKFYDVQDSKDKKTCKTHEEIKKYNRERQAKYRAKKTKILNENKFEKIDMPKQKKLLINRGYKNVSM